jgi:hypothetical protein
MRIRYFVVLGLLSGCRKDPESETVHATTNRGPSQKTNREQEQLTKADYIISEFDGQPVDDIIRIASYFTIANERLDVMRDLPAEVRAHVYRELLTKFKIGQDTRRRAREIAIKPIVNADESQSSAGFAELMKADKSKQLELVSKLEAARNSNEPGLIKLFEEALSEVESDLAVLRDHQEKLKTKTSQNVEGLRAVERIVSEFENGPWEHMSDDQLKAQSTLARQQLRNLASVKETDRQLAERKIEELEKTRHAEKEENDLIDEIVIKFENSRITKPEALKEIKSLKRASTSKVRAAIETVQTASVGPEKTNNNEHIVDSEKEKSERDAVEARAAELKRKAYQVRALEAQRRADEAARAVELKRKTDEVSASEAQRVADEAARVLEAQKRANEVRALEAQRRADEASRAAELKEKADEAQRRADEAAKEGKDKEAALHEIVKKYSQMRGDESDVENAYKQAVDSLPNKLTADERKNAIESLRAYADRKITIHRKEIERANQLVDNLKGFRGNQVEGVKAAAMEQLENFVVLSPQVVRQYKDKLESVAVANKPQGLEIKAEIDALRQARGDGHSLKMQFKNLLESACAKVGESRRAEVSAILTPLLEERLARYEQQAKLSREIVEELGSAKRLESLDTFSPQQIEICKEMITAAKAKCEAEPWVRTPVEQKGLGDYDTRDYLHLVIIPDVHGDAENFIHSLWIGFQQTEPAGHGITFPVLDKALRDAAKSVEFPEGKPKVVPVKPLSKLGRQIAFVQLGDIMDRGRQSYLSYKLLASVEAVIGWKSVQLFGNHDIMIYDPRVEGGFYLNYNKGETDMPDDLAKSLFKPGGALREYLNKNNLILARFGSPYGSGPKHANTLFVHGGLPHGWLCSILPDLGIGKRFELFVDAVNKAKRRDFSETPDETGTFAWSRMSPVFSRMVSYVDTSNEICSAEDACADLDQVLRKLNVDRIIVGHTPDRTVRAKCNSKFIVADVTMSRGFRLGGRPFAMVLSLSDDGSVASSLNAFYGNTGKVNDPPRVEELIRE